MRSRKGYWLGGGLVALGAIGAVLWFVISLVRLDGRVDDFQRVPVPGEATVRLEAEKHVIYFEGPNADEVVPRFEVTITDADSGEPLEIDPYSTSLTYTFSDNEGSAQATVTPPRAGDYAVSSDGGGDPEDRLAFGDSIAWPLVSAIIGTFAIGGLLALAGVILLVVTAIRRRKPPPAPGFGR